MCGICGVYVFDGAPATEGLLQAMTSPLAHRGPDATGVYIDQPTARVGLGHTRLKIIDLSEAAAQPMANEDGSVWVVFNGEIYNYRELRAELIAQGMRFRSSSDTEVLLRLYEVQGPRCVERLEGMFAFALWDRRNQRLCLARDRVGKKPLFYYRTPALFAFASEIKALFRHPGIHPEIAEQMLPSFFLFGYVPTPNTLYHHIQKLPPGHLAQIEADGSMRIDEYWTLPMRSEPIQVPRRTPEAAARVRELVTEAVRRRLIADVPLGAFLSGGIDSSIVVSVMSRLLEAPVRTFSIGFAGDPRFDETSYARLAAQRMGTLHTEFTVEPSSMDLIERLVRHHDGPFADSSAIPTYLLARLAREHVTVALNGDGGDELFAGYLRFPAALFAERVPLWLRRAARGLLGGLPEWGAHRSPLQRLQKFAQVAPLPFIERFSRWISVFYEDLPRLLPHCQDPRLAQTSLAVLDPILRSCHGASPLTRLLYVNLKTYLLDDLLVKMDRCSMAHALEVRSPFLDRELLEYAFSLPDAMKLRGTQTKAILRRAFADVLPQPILRRGKMGFGVPLRRWFAADLRDYLQDMLLAPGAQLKRYLNARYVGQLCQAHLAGRADYAQRLWTLLTFEVWLRQLPTWAAAPEAQAQPLLCSAKKQPA